MENISLPIPNNLGVVNNEYLVVIVLLTIIFLWVFVSIIKRIEKMGNSQIKQINDLVNSQMEYNKNKNDHMERMSDKFAETTEEMVSKVVAVHETVKNIAERNENMVTLAKSSLDNNTRQLQALFEKLK